MFRFKSFKKYSILILSILSGFLASVFYSSDFSLREETPLIERMLEAFYRPTANVFQKTVSTLTNFYSFISQTHQKALLYDELLPKVEHISYLEAQIKYLKEENTRIKELLQLTQGQKEAYLAVKIIGRDPNYIFESLRIDRGQEDGLKPGQGLISTKGVVGTIFRTWNRTSDVLIITDPNSHLDALVQRNNLRVILTGHGNQELLFKHTHNHDPIMMGDRLVTSGYSGSFPPGIPIGIVSKVLNHSHGHREIFVEPDLQVDQLSEALVIQEQDPYMEIIDKSHQHLSGRAASNSPSEW
jgi:rod shape-determining protein MreC